MGCERKSFTLYLVGTTKPCNVVRAPSPLCPVLETLMDEAPSVLELMDLSPNLRPIPLLDPPQTSSPDSKDAFASSASSGPWKSVRIYCHFCSPL